MLTKWELIIFKMHQDKYFIHSKFVFVSINLLLPITKMSLSYSQSNSLLEVFAYACLLHGRRIHRYR